MRMNPKNFAENSGTQTAPFLDRYKEGSTQPQLLLAAILGRESEDLLEMRATTSRMWRGGTTNIETAFGALFGP